MADRVKERTGQKGKALFHPIRVALTGEGGGPELDLAVPAIDRGAQLLAGRGRRDDPRACARAGRERSLRAHALSTGPLTHGLARARPMTERRC